MKQTILTGIRSNEEPTIGNYLGAFLPMVDMQQQFSSNYSINMFVPDLHSFTTPIDHSKLYDQTIHNLKYYAAAGLDIHNPNTFIYRQSFVPAHSELTWILSCFTYMGEMGRMIQFKDKSSNKGESVSVGLFSYPILMAADILLYGAKWVPVGEDQFQHLEIARDIAMRFNSKFGDIFIVPEPTSEQSKFIQRDSGLRIRSLSDPAKKMSKSSEENKSKILLSDTPELAAKKIMSATTDSVGVINFDWDNQPGITNLLQLLSLFTKTDQHQINQNWVGKTVYGDLKKEVANSVSDFLQNFQNTYNQISDEEVYAALERSESAMNLTATQMLTKVQSAVGLRKRG